MFEGSFGQRPLQHLCGARNRDEADPSFVGDDDIAGRNANARDLDIAIDFDRFDAPLARDRSYFGGPERIAYPTRMADVTDPSKDDGACFTLP